MKREERGPGQVSMSVEQPEQVQRIGHSPDFGFCLGKKQDGGRCSAVVNRSQCEFCVHHAKTALKQLQAKRPELSGAGRSLFERQLVPIVNKAEAQRRARAQAGRAHPSLHGQQLAETAQQLLVARGAGGKRTRGLDAVLAVAQQDEDQVSKKPRAQCAAPASSVQHSRPAPSSSASGSRPPPALSAPGCPLASRTPTAAASTSSQPVPATSIAGASEGSDSELEIEVDGPDAEPSASRPLTAAQPRHQHGHHRLACPPAQQGRLLAAVQASRPGAAAATEATASHTPAGLTSVRGPSAAPQESHTGDPAASSAPLGGGDTQPSLLTAVGAAGGVQAEGEGQAGCDEASGSGQGHTLVGRQAAGGEAGGAMAAGGAAAAGGAMAAGGAAAAAAGGAMAAGGAASAAGGAARSGGRVQGGAAGTATSAAGAGAARGTLRPLPASLNPVASAARPSHPCPQASLATLPTHVSATAQPLKQQQARQQQQQQRGQPGQPVRQPGQQPGQQQPSSGPASSASGGRGPVRPAPITASSAMAAAFASVVADGSAGTATSARAESRYQQLGEDAEFERMTSAMAVLEQKDALASKLDATTKLSVSAWQCEDCNGALTEFRPKDCAGHRLTKVNTTKRWWQCGHCNARSSTLGVIYPSNRCPKCNDPGKVFKQATMYAGAKAVAPDANSKLAARENFLARGTEHSFALNGGP
ncbi:hypothetical protein QJQ45_028439 [Haematococcus lacustris]|nr:hypothetical protein QJQ45_028439 [Haematococcus lacustris]